MQIAIIGSGIAGMATAARLAHQGHEVEVFEANAYPGGKVSLLEMAGYRFDAGPSLFTLPHLVDDTIAYCGRNPRDYYQYEKIPVACRYFWEDGTELTAWGDKEKFAREAEHIIGEPATKTLRYLQRAADMYHTTAPLFLEKSLHQFSTYVNKDAWQALKSLHQLNLTRTLHQVNARERRHPKMTQLFDRFATYNGSSPYLTPGVMSMIPHLEHNVGTFYPKGGLHSVTQALYKLAQDEGVQFHFCRKAEKINVKNGRATGIRVQNKPLHYDVVVSNMDVMPTYRKLLSEQPAPEKTLRQPRSSSALIFYWGIKKEFPQLDLHNIFFSEDYREEFEQIFKDGKVYHDPTIYVNISSKRDKNDAPAGSENWFTMINVPGNTGQDWDTLIKEVRTNTLAKLQRILKVKVEDYIECEEILDPRLIEAKTQSYQGSLYGASSNNSMAAFLRHPNFSQKIKGLYFCGGSVHPGGGIPLCLLSAKITASLIQKNYGRNKK